jgi:hypothetical protein
MNINIKVDVKGALLKGTAPEIVQAGLDGFVEEACSFLHREVAKRTPQGRYGAQGGLIQSIQKGKIVGKGTPLVKGSVVTASKYGEVIEKGRRPGKGIASAAAGDKYVSPLLPWIETKLGISGKEAERVAYLIGRKIKLQGFEGRHMFEKAVSENQGVLDAMAARYGLTIATELNK